MICLKQLSVQKPLLAESNRREKVKKMIRVFNEHLLNEDLEIQVASCTCLASCLEENDQYAGRIMAPYLLCFFDKILQSSPDWSRAVSAMRLLRMLYSWMSKAQRRTYMSQLVKLLQDWRKAGHQLNVLNVLYRMKELWTVEAKPKATFPEAFEQLMKMMQSTSVDLELRHAIYELYLRS